MEISRRQFFVSIASVLWKKYLDSIKKNQKKLDRSTFFPPTVRGKIFADLHAHPSRENSIEDILSTLSWGVTGLAERNSKQSVLAYSDALSLPATKEIDKGIFASLTYHGATGYFIKAEEIEGEQHILAVGCKTRIPYVSTTSDVIKEIRKQGGIAILNHPSVIPCWYSPINYRFITHAEEKSLIDLCRDLDEVETFNAQAIKFNRVIDLSEATAIASRIALASGHKGMAGSDAHYSLDQVKMSGNYINSDGLCFESIRESIRKKEFISYYRPIGLASFIAGHMLY